MDSQNHRPQCMQRDASRDGDVERVDRGSYRDRDSIVSGGERRIRQASPFCANEQHDPTVPMRGEPLDRDPVTVRRQRRYSPAVRAKHAERARPWLGNRPGELQHGAHRGTKRLAIQRIGGRRADEDAAGTEGGSSPEETTDVVRIPDGFEREQHAFALQPAIDRGNRRPARECKASSVKVEARDLLHRLRAADEHLSVNGLEPQGQCVVGRRRQQDRFDRETLRVHQPFDDEPALGDEQSSRQEPRCIADARVRSKPRIGRRGEIVHPSHAVVSLRDRRPINRYALRSCDCGARPERAGRGACSGRPSIRRCRTDAART